jgi:hypothetical protein
VRRSPVALTAAPAPLARAAAGSPVVISVTAASWLYEPRAP